MTTALLLCLLAQPAADPVFEWPQYKGDAGLTGVSADASVRPPLKLLWTYRLDGDASGDAGAGVTVGGGLVYVNVHNTRSIVAVNAHTGQFAWEYADSSVGYKTVPSYADGRLFLWERQNKTTRALALDARTGKLLWEFPLKSEHRTSHRAGLPEHAGRVYCSEGGDQPAVLALDAATGKLLLKVILGKEDGPAISTPTVAGGKIFVGTADALGFRAGTQGAVFALDAESGKVLWRKPDIFPYKCLSSDGQVVACPMFGKTDTKHYLLDAKTGDTLWQSPGKHHYSPVTIAGERILVTPYGGDFASYERRSGQTQWQFNSQSRSGCCSPVVSGDFAYIGSGVVSPGDVESIAAFQRTDAPREKAQGGTLFAVDLRTGKAVWHFSTGNTICGEPALAYGRLYCAGRDGRVYCFTPARDGEPITPTAKDTAPPVAAARIEKLLEQAVPLQGWPMAGGTPRRAGSPVAQVRLPLEAAWSFDTGGRVLTSAALADGKVCVASDGGKITLLTATGQKLWDFAAGAAVRCSPALVDGMVYCGSDRGVFHALDGATGQEKWRFETGGPIQASPAVVGGVVVFAAHDHHVYALDRHTGQRLWSCKLNDYRIQAAPVVHGDTVYVGQWTDWVWAIDLKTGQAKWRSFIPLAIESVAWHGDRVYARSPYYVVELDPATGKRLRIGMGSYGYGGLAFHDSSIVQSGVLGQTGTNGASLLNLADPGKPINRDIPTLEGVRMLSTKGLKSSPSLASMVAPLVLGNQLCFASRTGLLTVTELDGTIQWRHALPAGCHAPPVAAAGLLVVGCDDGKVYAFREK